MLLQASFVCLLEGRSTAFRGITIECVTGCRLHGTGRRRCLCWLLRFQRCVAGVSIPCGYAWKDNPCACCQFVLPGLAACNESTTGAIFAVTKWPAEGVFWCNSGRHRSVACAAIVSVVLRRSRTLSAKCVALRHLTLALRGTCQGCHECQLDDSGVREVALAKATQIWDADW